jgi:hypothetical protein
MAVATCPLGPIPAFAQVDCVASFSRILQRVRDRIIVPTPRVQVCSYQPFMCYENVLPILQSLRESGDDLTKARVLYVNHLGPWNVHVIVEHQGRIFDANLGSQATDGHSIPGIKASTYFSQNRVRTESRVLEIPGERYLQEYDQDTWSNYQKQLFGTSERDSGIHRWTIDGFLRRLSRTEL